MISTIEKEMLNIIRGSEYFDHEWYCEQYPDVNILQMDPALHFLRYGGLLKRSPGPNFDTLFYLETYQNSWEFDHLFNNPLVSHHLSCSDEFKPVCRQQLQSMVLAEKAASSDCWPQSFEDRANTKIISYCIPVMGRLSDLQGTLHHNLKENDLYRDHVEFLIVDFGQSREVEQWVGKIFHQQIASGYLRVVNEPDILDTWHFGKAKNVFRAHMLGDVYSSLDADNFVTSEETTVLLDTASNYPFGFVYHHFSGNWGDGTCGRVSMPAWVYRRVGYDERLMPRQFDEFDLIMGGLKRYPSIPFISTNSVYNAFTMSGFCESFRKEERLPNRFLVQECKYIKPPLNPRGIDYPEQNPHWRAMNNFNGVFSSISHGTNLKFADQNRKQLHDYKLDLIEKIPESIVIDTLFYSDNHRCINKVNENDICLLSCVHDEEHFLPNFVKHYRSLGVNRFFIIDDHSSKPVIDLNLGDDVTVLRPKVGSFETCKTLWLEGIIKAHIPPHSWVLTVDADEFVQLPLPFHNFTELTNHLASEGRDYVIGLLLDMVPAPDRFWQEDLANPEQFDFNFSHFYFTNTAPSTNYSEHPSIRWAFGDEIKLSWCTDIRHHAFGTYDSMRKFPLFRHRSNRHLNQGFHTFHYLDDTSPPGAEIWTSGPILPIFHYKLVKLFSDESRRRMLSVANHYHARTRENIVRIFEKDDKVNIKILESLSQNFRPSVQALDRNFYHPVSRT